VGAPQHDEKQRQSTSYAGLETVGMPRMMRHDLPWKLGGKRRAGERETGTAVDTETCPALGV